MKKAKAVMLHIISLTLVVVGFTIASYAKCSIDTIQLEALFHGHNSAECAAWLEETSLNTAINFSRIASNLGFVVLGLGFVLLILSIIFFIKIIDEEE